MVWPRFRRSLPLLLALLLISFSVVLIGWAGGTSLANAPDENWARPVDKALHNLGPGSGSTGYGDVDCMHMSYRTVDDPDGPSYEGCFVRSAFGYLDPAKSLVLWNGTDEAMPLYYGGQPAALSAFPGSATVARFGGFPTAGRYMYLYNYLPASLTTERGNGLQRVKEISGAVSQALMDEQGSPLPVNPGALAYSGRGYWMIAESPGNAFVRVSLADFSILPFENAFFSSGSPYANYRSNLAITDDGRYAVITNIDNQWLRVYDLASCTAGTASGLMPQSCQYHNYWNYVEGQIGQPITGLARLRFVNDGLLTFDATTSDGITTYALAPRTSIGPLIPYLGMGDSYASGEGTFNYRAVTANGVNNCHLSARAYPGLLSLDLFGGAGQSVACSGATMHDLGDQSDNYSSQTTDQRSVKSRYGDGTAPQYLHDFTPGYLAQANFVASYQPDAISVQVGGNDIGFKDMILRCVLPLSQLWPPHLQNNDCYSSYEDRVEVERLIAGKFNSWVSLYKQLRQLDPEGRVYAIGYPQIVANTGQCGANVRLSPGDIDFTQFVISYLNDVIGRAAKSAGVRYVDISSALEGHKLCQDKLLPGMNGITAGSAIDHVLGKESYHPTAFGHQLMEQAILAATNRLTAPSGGPTPNPTPDPSVAAPVPSGSDALLKNAPKTGRTLVRRSPSTTLVSGNVKKGGKIRVKASGTDHGLAPGGTYTVSVGGQPAGSLTADNQGNIDGELPVPPGSTGGITPVDVTGNDQNGDPVDVTTVVTVDPGGDDPDGDGIPDSQDSCPLVYNSGQDIDGDGLDDACDSDLTPPPSGSGDNNIGGGSTTGNSGTTGDGTTSGDTSGSNSGGQSTGSPQTGGSSPQAATSDPQTGNTGLQPNGGTAGLNDSLGLGQMSTLQVQASSVAASHGSLLARTAAPAKVSVGRSQAKGAGNLLVPGAARLLPERPIAPKWPRLPILAWRLIAGALLLLGVLVIILKRLEQQMKSD